MRSSLNFEEIFILSLICYAIDLITSLDTSRDVARLFFNLSSSSIIASRTCQNLYCTQNTIVLDPKIDFFVLSKLLPHIIIVRRIFKLIKNNTKINKKPIGKTLIILRSPYMVFWDFKNCIFALLFELIAQHAKKISPKIHVNSSQYNSKRNNFSGNGIYYYYYYYYGYSCIEH